MEVSYLKQGQKIDAICGPESEEQIAACVGRDGVTEIVIGQCRGPMGFFDVALVIRSGTERAVEVIPVHMAEYIRLLPPAEGW